MILMASIHSFPYIVCKFFLVSLSCICLAVVLELRLNRKSSHCVEDLKVKLLKIFLLKVNVYDFSDYLV